MSAAAIKRGSLVRLIPSRRDDFQDHRIAVVRTLGDDARITVVSDDTGSDHRWAGLSIQLGGRYNWSLNDLELAEDNMARVGNDAQSRAEVDFDVTRPLKLTRSEYQPHEKCVYIYSPAVDGFNPLRVATVQIANVTGINGEQIEFLTNKIADSIVEALA